VIPTFDLDASWFLKGNEEEFVKEGLHVLIHSMNREANLTGLGKVFAYWVVHSSLQQLDCVTNALKSALVDEQQQLGVENFPAPLIVLGLPRTGTTFMHAMLSQDDSFRAPRFHEYMSACPKPSLPANRTLWEQMRVAFQGYKMLGIRILLPSLSAMHRMSFSLNIYNVLERGTTICTNQICCIYRY